MKCPICESELPDEGSPTVARLKLEPGDQVVLSCPQRLSEAAKVSLVRSWQRFMPRVKAIILDDGMAVQVLSPEGVERQ